MAKKYDIIIVGGGPAGIFTALELAQRADLSILLIEKGKDIDQRTNLVCGLGGAGAYSDGKLTLSAQVGGRLQDYLGKNVTEALTKYVDETYLKFGAPDRVYGTGDEVDRVSRQAALAGLRLIPVPLRHLGTERCRSILKAIHTAANPSALMVWNRVIVGWIFLARRKSRSANKIFALEMEKFSWRVFKWGLTESELLSSLDFEW